MITQSDVLCCNNVCYVNKQEMNIQKRNDHEIFVNCVMLAYYVAKQLRLPCLVLLKTG